MKAQGKNLSGEGFTYTTKKRHLFDRRRFFVFFGKNRLFISPIKKIPIIL